MVIRMMNFGFRSVGQRSRTSAVLRPSARFLIGFFRRHRFDRAAALRRAHLARSAEQTVILAAFERSRLLRGPVAEIPARTR
jgi:hypothetical protein